jgi:hypothetical protein
MHSTTACSAITRIDHTATIFHAARLRSALWRVMQRHMAMWGRWPAQHPDTNAPAVCVCVSEEDATVPTDAFRWHHTWSRSTAPLTGCGRQHCTRLFSPSHDPNGTVTLAELMALHRMLLRTRDARRASLQQILASILSDTRPLAVNMHAMNWGAWAMTACADGHAVSCADNYTLHARAWTAALLSLQAQV